MTAITIKHFDALDYVEHSRSLGVDERVAKYQARQIEQVIEIVTNNARSEIENRELATKQDIKELEFSTKKDMQILQKDIKELELKLQAEIHKSKFELIIWVVGLFIVSGLIQHFFK